MLPPIKILEKKILTAQASEVEFTGILAKVAKWNSDASVTSRHLVLIINAKSPDAVDYRVARAQFNSDTGQNYYNKSGTGINSSASSGRNNVTYIECALIAGTTYSDAFTGSYTLIPAAFQTSNHKTALVLDRAAEAVVAMRVGRWASLNAIDSIKLNASTGNFDIGSEFILAVVDERYCVEEKIIAAPTTDALFSSLGNEEGDLVLIASLRFERAANYDLMYCELNGDVADASYFYQTFRAEGASAFDAYQANTRHIHPAMPAATINPGVYGTLLMFQPDYRGANKKQSLAAGGFISNTSSDNIIAVSRYWNKSNALTSVKLLGHYSNISAGSILSLYRVPLTKELLQRTKLSSNQASVTFDSISNKYDALVLSISARTDNGGVNDECLIKVNDDATAANYQRQQLYGSSSTVGADRSQVRRIGQLTGNGVAASLYGAINTIIPKYARTDGHKQLLSFQGRINALVGINSLRYKSTNAITKLELTPELGSNFMAGSVFELWGIRVGGIPNFRSISTQRAAPSSLRTVASTRTLIGVR